MCSQLINMNLKILNIVVGNLNFDYCTVQQWNYKKIYQVHDTN